MVPPVAATASAMVFFREPSSADAGVMTPSPLNLEPAKMDTESDTSDSDISFLSRPLFLRIRSAESCSLRPFSSSVLKSESFMVSDDVSSSPASFSAEVR